MPGRLAPLGAAVRLLGVLALLGLVAMHGTTSAHAAHGAVTAGPAAVVVAAPADGHAAGTGAKPTTCPMDHHGQSATMDCTSAAPSPGPSGGTALAARAASHLLPPAALPQWPSLRSATFAPPVAAPSHVILRT